jgi:hypothetical protein
MWLKATDSELDLQVLNDSRKVNELCKQPSKTNIISNKAASDNESSLLDCFGDTLLIGSDQRAASRQVHQSRCPSTS